MPSDPGWYELPNTKLRPVCATEPSLRGSTGCAAVIDAWNSGVFDTKRNRLILWGGGHADYYGNELYALNLEKFTVERLTEPGLPAADRKNCVRLSPMTLSQTPVILMMGSHIWRMWIACSSLWRLPCLRREKFCRYLDL